jgi:L-arabinose transport system substrate-binding protein
MKRINLVVLTALSVVLLFNGGVADANDPVKIGFVVKQPEEPWF